MLAGDFFDLGPLQLQAKKLNGLVGKAFGDFGLQAEYCRFTVTLENEKWILRLESLNDYGTDWFCFQSGNDFEGKFKECLSGVRSVVAKLHAIMYNAASPCGFHPFVSNYSGLEDDPDCPYLELIFDSYRNSWDMILGYHLYYEINFDQQAILRFRINPRLYAGIKVSIEISCDYSGDYYKKPGGFKSFSTFEELATKLPTWLENRLIKYRHLSRHSF
ncbi:MAG: hypothetical protein WBG50_24030 [Desulfomonilaceae bacterium]